MATRLLVLVGLAFALAACGGGDDDARSGAEPQSSSPAQGTASRDEVIALFDAYVTESKALAPNWPKPGDDEAAKQAGVERQRPHVDRVGELAAQAAALSGATQPGTPLEELAAAMQDVHAGLAARIAALSQPDAWQLDGFCHGVGTQLQSTVRLRAALGAVVDAYQIPVLDDAQQLDAAHLATLAVCREAINHASEPLATPAGGLAPGTEQQAEQVQDSMRELATATAGFHPVDPLVEQARSTFAELVDLDIRLVDAAKAYQRDPNLSDADSARAFLEQNRPLAESQLDVAQRWVAIAQQVSSEAG